jgi:hypothetical protein
VADIDDSEVVEPELLFTENNTNYHRLYGGQNDSPYVKDAFHDHIIPSHCPDSGKPGFFHTKIRSRTRSSQRHTSNNDSEDSGEEEGPRTPYPVGSSFVNPKQKGTKSAVHYTFSDVAPEGGCAVVRLKLTQLPPSSPDPTLDDEGYFDEMIEDRRDEADEFYNALTLDSVSDDFKQIMRQAFGGMLWTKQYYQFVQKEWISGDPAQPPPPPERKYIRNKVVGPERSCV